MKNRTPATSSLSAALRESLASGRLKALTRAAVGFGALSPLMALANPTGGQVVGGIATIAAPNPNSTRITQTSQNAVINWQSFSVGANQYVQFLQPDSSATILNRVIGSNPSNIFGNISSNGQVFLVNPNGILFGRGAVLDVGGLVASTQDITDSDFMSGKYNFVKGSGAPDASVVNQGSISTRAGGYVVLAGDYVENDGAINAKSGQVLLAAGGGTTLTFDNNQLIGYAINSATLANLAGVSNTGEITAEGGAVIMTADVANALTATAVNNSGFIAARSIQGHAGLIVLSATGGETENSGTLDASADQVNVTGGTIVVRSNDYTELTPTSIINDAGDSAAGGFLHVSGHELGIHGQFNLGKGGQLILDPTTVRIESSGTANSAQCSGCEGGVIHTNFIQHTLNAGINLAIIASGQIKDSSGGNHNAGPATHITATGTGNLALRIGHTSGTIGGSLHGNFNGANGSNLAWAAEPGNSGDIFVPTTGGTINIKGMTISIAGAFAASADQGTVKLGPVTAAVIAVNAGTIQLNGNLKATAATANHVAIALQASGSIVPGSGSPVVGLTANTGNVQVIAGGDVHVTGNISAPNGSIEVQTNFGNVNIGGSMAAKTVTVLDEGYGASVTLHNITATGALSSGTTIDEVNLGKDGIAILNGNGAVTAGSAGVMWKATGGGVKVIGGEAGGVTVGSISAAGILSIQAHNNPGGPSKIQVLGTDTLKAQSVFLTASGSYGGAITANDITATGASGSLVLIARNTSGFAGSAAITTGNLTGAGVVNVSVSGRNSKISVGTVSAGHLAEFSADSFASTGPLPVSIQTGPITSPNISLRTFGRGGATITVGPLSAVNPSGAASVTINNFAGASSGGVTVNGGITVSGKTSAAPRIGPNSNPVVATLNVEASGSGGFTQKLTVNGPISVTATKGPYMGSSFFEGGPHGGTKTTFHGSGALVSMTLNVNGTASVTGPITVSGADAEVSIDAQKITLGNVSVTASGHSIARMERAGSNTTQVMFSSQNNFGVAQLGIGEQSFTKSITASNITVSGRGQAAAVMAGQNITVGGGVTVTALPATLSWKGTHSNGLSGSHIVNASESVAHYGFASLDVFAHGAARAGSSLASFTGDINVKGPTATVIITGGAIHARNISVTGSGSTVVRHATGSTSQGAINYSAKYKTGVAELTMAASFGTSGNSKASITAGNITAQGVAGGLVSLKGATISTGKIQIDVTGGSLAVTGTAPQSANTVFGAPHFYPSDATTQQLAGYPTAGLSIAAAVVPTPVFSVNVGDIVASNSAGLALVRISGALATVSKITTGSISVTGKGPTTVEPVANQFQPYGAELFIQPGFNSQDTVTINGNVKVTGEAAHYTINVPTGTGNGLTSATGTDGWALTSIQAYPGHVTLNGALSETGVGYANAFIEGANIKITGPITVNSTPANQHSVGRSYSGSGVASFTIANAGRAALTLSGGSQAADSITVGGAITLNGTQNVTLRISGANINTKAISVTAGPTGPYKYTQSHSYDGATNINSSGSKAGWAIVDLNGTGLASAANVTVGGAITVSGVGQARVVIQGSHVTAQDISVTAAAENATLTYGTPPSYPHHLFSNGSSLTAIDNGHETGAIGVISIVGAGYGSGNPAQTVNVNGNLSVKAAGLAQITVLGRTVDVTGSVAASATKASVNGKASSSGHDTRTLVGSIGLAEVSLSGGNTSGAVSVGSAIKVKGPDAMLQVNASTIKLGNITVTGSGHNVSLTQTPRSAATVLYSSQNDGGFATVALSNLHPGVVNAPPAVSIKTGNITVTGKGLAQVEMFASHVSAGSIDVTATAATTTRTGTFVQPSYGSCTGICDSGSILFNNFNGGRVLTGTVTRGRAGVIIGNNPTSSSGRLTPAMTVNVGPLSVTGVGSASVAIFGSSIQAKSVTATATKGSVAAQGSSFGRGSSGISGTFKNSITGKGGNAGVSLLGGNVTVTGNIAATGPAAGVQIKANGITVTGGITVRGSGASVTTDTVFTSVANAATYHLHYTGSNANHLDGVDLEASNAVAVGGTIKVTTPGLMGILAVGKTVTVGGISASDTGPAHYSVLNTHKSPTTISFSASDIALVTAGKTSSAGVFTPDVVTGNVSLTAKGNIFMPDDLSVAGTVTVKAGGNITGSAGGVITKVAAVGGAHNNRHGGSSGSGSFNSAQLPRLSLAAQSATFSAGKNISLANETLTVTTGNAQLLAGGSLSINGVTLTGGGNVSLTGKTLGISGASIKAGKALGITATGGGIGLQNTLSGSAVNLTAAGVVSDGGVGHTLTAGAGGLSIKATGNVTLTGETLKVTGAAAAVSGATIDLTGAQVSAGRAVTLTATKNILLGKTAITAGGALDMTASGSISNGGSAATLQAVGGTLKAKTGNINLPSETLNVGTGTLTMSAAGNMTLTSATLDASNAHLTAAGSIDLTSATLNAPKTVGLISDKNIILTGVTITTAAMTATASGSVEDGGPVGTITAGAIAVVAGKGINLSSTQLNIGNGTLASIHGDAELVGVLAGEGIAPASANPNGAFIANGPVLLGGLTLTGSYLLLQGTSVSLLGPVTVPAGTLVQVTPFDPTTVINVEDLPTAATGFDLSNQTFLSLFPGATIAIGNVDQTGAVELGSNGPFNIGATNLIVDTQGTVTGLSNVTSTGLVVSLLAIAGPPVPPVTAGEIDPSTTSTGTGDQTDKKKLSSGGTDTGNGQQGGTTSQDNGNTGVCH